MRLYVTIKAVLNEGHIDMFEEIIREIEEYDKIIIHRHSNPDGDAIGSQIGLKSFIAENYPQKRVYAVGDDPKRYSFIEDSKPDVIDDAEYQGALAIILDSAVPSLVSDQRFRLAEKTIRIDHHIFCEKFADIEFIDTSFESCSGEIAALIKESGRKPSAKTAKIIFTGIVTDSGRFRYDSTSPRTFKLASFLLETGFDMSDVYSNLYASDFEDLKLRAEFILKIRFTPKNVAYIYTTLEELKKTGADTFTVSRGMVNTMSDIRGVDIWVNFTETGNEIIAELRSSKYNINPIAVKYGGGGHAKASGASLKSRDEAMRMLDDLESLILE